VVRRLRRNEQRVRRAGQRRRWQDTSVGDERFYRKLQVQLAGQEQEAHRGLAQVAVQEEPSAQLVLQVVPQLPLPPPSGG
jgi:hypothetical protein